MGATCEQLDASGTTVGVSDPIRIAGFYRFESRSSYLSSDCKNPSTWELGDPCRSVDEPDITYRLRNCSHLRNFDKYWNRKRIFACLSGNEFYTCDVR